MYEIKHIVQDDDKQRKRWFNDPICDLIVWEADQESIDKFQFYYKKSGNEFMVEWNKNQELQYANVDSGDSALRNFSPVIVRGKKQRPDDIIFFFMYRSLRLDQKVKSFVLEKLKSGLS